MATTAIKERPILFSGEMVRAILDGRKTQTRRVVKPFPPDYIDELHGDELRRRAPYETENDDGFVVGFGFQGDSGEFYHFPYGKPGDRLWVRETWAPIPEMRPSGYWSNPSLTGRDVWYRATDRDLPTWGGKWRPSIHMPRWASRITLQITDVRVERVQEIDNEAALAEGVETTPLGWKHYELDSQAYTLTPRASFCTLWDSINGNRDGCSWAANPWVWVVEFEKVSR